MGGNLGELVNELTERFNDSQDAIEVTATYQGSYDDTYNALLAAFETGSEPNIIQNFDLASQTMIDTGRLVPAWQLAARPMATTWTSSCRPCATTTPMTNGMVGMAFNSSTPLLYYNAGHVRSRRR